MAAKNVQSIGKNLKAVVDGDNLIITINLKERHGPSGSGKTIIVASTGGNQSVDGSGGVILGLNAYVKP